MKKSMLVGLLAVSLALVNGAFVAPPRLAAVRGGLAARHLSQMFSHEDDTSNAQNAVPAASSSVKLSAKATLAPMMLALLASAAPAEAATGQVASALPSAFAAYGHYLGLVLFCLSLATERVLVKPDMSKNEVHAPAKDAATLPALESD